MVERGHFKGFWTLPEVTWTTTSIRRPVVFGRPSRNLGLTVVLDDVEPVITQRIFNDEGISFVSFTYRSTWNGELGSLMLQTEEISAAAMVHARRCVSSSSVVLRPASAEIVCLITGPTADELHQERRQDRQLGTTALRKRGPATATPIDVCGDGTKQFDGIVPFTCRVFSVTPIINFPPLSLDPRTASVGVSRSSVNSLSIVVIDLRSPSTSMTTIRTPSTSVLALPPPDVRKRTIRIQVARSVFAGPSIPQRNVQQPLEDLRRGHQTPGSILVPVHPATRAYASAASPATMCKRSTPS